MSSGRLLRARATRSRTSAAARSGSRESSNSIVIADTCSRESEVRCLMPSIPISSSSSGSVTEASTTSGAAPGYTVVTDTIGASTSGSSRLGRRSSAIAPSSTISSESTLAKTGRSTQISESRTGLGPAAQRGAALRGGCGGGRDRGDLLALPHLVGAGRDDAVARPQRRLHLDARAVAVADLDGHALGVVVGHDATHGEGWRDAVT